MVGVIRREKKRKKRRKEKDQRKRQGRNTGYWLLEMGASSPQG